MLKEAKLLSVQNTLTVESSHKYILYLYINLHIYLYIYILSRISKLLLCVTCAPVSQGSASSAAFSFGIVLVVLLSHLEIVGLDSGFATHHAFATRMNRSPFVIMRRQVHEQAYDTYVVPHMAPDTWTAILF